MAGSERRVAAAAVTCSLVIVMSLLLGVSQAMDILVGGKTDAWKIPSSQSDSLNQWAESARFRIGDALVWKYDWQKDSVLQVTKEAYLTCNTSSPIEEYRDGNTKITLDRSGPFYFISGAEGHCAAGQKMIVVVLSARLRYTGVPPAPSPSSVAEGPAVAPTSIATTLRAATVTVVAAAAFGFMALGLF